MAAKSSLRVIETSKMSPPAGSILTASIPLTFFDVIFLHLPPVEYLFFYAFPHSTSEFLSSYLSTLKSSLSLTLQSFYPLAGNIRLVPEKVEKHEIHCTGDDFVMFTVAESHLDLEELSGDEPRATSELKLMVPGLCKNESNGFATNLAVQVTIFPSRGIVIGIAVHHAVCDGSSIINFMRTWASIHCMNNFTTTLTPASVMIDRSIIPDPNGSIYSATFDGMKNMGTKHSNQVESSNDNTFMSSFILNKEHIKLLKEVLYRESAKRNVQVHSSTVLVTYAFVWIGYIKAKSFIAENKDARCVFAVDLRNYLHPIIPETYFGNCLGPCFLRANTIDLLGQDGFFLACQAIREGFEEVKRDGIKYAKNWVKYLSDSISKMPLSAGGSPRFKVYDVDFGWGKPIKVEITTIASSGGMSITESRDEQGGVEVGLSFTKLEMEVFKKYFEESLQHLSSIN
ncbi:hypothetical protein LUZ60_002422 [Juncus effusus]|nr:hypothetical protein LUZ60_002422 [Juncus effusus]